MSRKQRLGFFLAGMTFLLCGIIMAACGWIYAITSLKGQGVMFILAAVFWLILAAFAKRRPSNANCSADKNDSQ
jgi:membrane protein implicated in regulation of membrane protease activity